MSRTSWAVICILVAIIVVIFIIEWIPNKELAKNIDRLSDAVQRNAYDTAQDELSQITDYWKKSKFWFSLENSFDKIEDVDVAIERLKFYVENRINASAVLEAKILSYHWNQLAE